MLQPGVKTSRVAALFAAHAVLLALCALQVAGDPFLVERPDISRGLWVLVFMEDSACQPCHALVSWLIREQEAFPEFRYVLSYPSLDLKTSPRLPQGMDVYLDREAEFGHELKVELSPTVLVFASGRLVTRLRWPFNEGTLLRGLATAAILAAQMPLPSALLNTRGADFVARNASGDLVSFVDLPRPLLLMFFAPDCPPCWESLQMIASLGDGIHVVLLLITDSGALQREHELRLQSVAGDHTELVYLLLQDPTALGRYAVSRSPTYFAIDAEGIIRSTQEGYATEAQLELLTAQLLADVAGPWKSQEGG
jgi:hypothetical protein